jgi:hypothetical protein
MSHIPTTGLLLVPASIHVIFIWMRRHQYLAAVKYTDVLNATVAYLFKSWANDDSEFDGAVHTDISDSTVHLDPETLFIY